MPVIRIRETAAEKDSWSATVSFDGEGDYQITIKNPFSTEEEQNLEWYFEEHLEFPFTGQVRAREAAASIERYGIALFEQIFNDREVNAHYQAALQGGLEKIKIEIVGSPEFHQLHWESIVDPRIKRPLALDAPTVRKTPRPQVVKAQMRPSPTINLLLIVSRPGEQEDIGYRTISRPLIELLRGTSLRVQVDIVRPGTFKALSNHLEGVKERHGAGYYHVIHFDGHGSLFTHQELLSAGSKPDQFVYQSRYGRDDLERYEGQKAFLLLEGETGKRADPVEAGELATLLLRHQIPIVILNACQSGKQVGATETSLASRLLQAGVQTAVAMSYSVTVSAAKLMMQTLYERLFAGSDLAAAIRRGRQELYNDKSRRAYFQQQIDLEDWLLPVVYQNSEVQIATRELSEAEEKEHYAKKSDTYLFPMPRPVYGFEGRDLDVLRIEKKLLDHNLLLVRGMGGAGKTTLLKHLGVWWQTTNFVERVFYFGYDERGWTRQQVINQIARQMMSDVEFARFQGLGLEGQQAKLTETLRATRHLLILDNLESITGSHLAIQNTLPPEEQQALKRLLAALVDGKSLVLLGSRSGEEWLSEGTFNKNLHDLSGLDPESASLLAERILEKHQATKYRQEDEFRRLLKLLAGYPLALEVVLPNLTRQGPGEILEALQAGKATFDTGDTSDKTKSVIRCIEYSHSNLSPEAQQLLYCLAPFTSVIFTGAMEKYIEQLKEQPVLEHLPFARWDGVIGEAIDWGLLSPDPEAPGFLRIQPVFPYFLRGHLNDPGLAEIKTGVETAFRTHYKDWGISIGQLLNAKDPQLKMLGPIFAGLEYENLMTALNLSLTARESILASYGTLSLYLNFTQDHRRGLELGQVVLSQLERYGEDKLLGPLGREFVAMADDIAKRQLLLKQYAQAESSYRKALSLAQGLSGIEKELQAGDVAGIYHQLGMVAEEQREWEQAERNYREALSIKIEFKDRHSQAGTYHQLGMIAQKQRQWEQAERHYREALAIKIEFKDRYSQASTYHQLGGVSEEQQQWEQAERHYQEALAIFIEFKDRHSQASTYHQLGRVAQKQRQWKQAERHYREALAVWIEFKDRYSQSLAYHQLGTVAGVQREWGQAERHYQEALAIRIEFKDRYSQAGTYHQLGLVAEEQRQWEQAERHYQEALTIFIEFNDQYHLPVVLWSLVRMWKESGRSQIVEMVAAAFGMTSVEAERKMNELIEPDSKPDGP
ncbi:MAG TPA: tetratricopeptide repeat protein [Blastocatellia bacterium]|nr:tetratricopeptide repeat protein [Blastocatellia bacterium]